MTQFQRIMAVFPSLTPKQHEVLAFVAENCTSKEIAWELGISESAVNQRVEGVRSRTGSPPRAELARAYRQYQQDQIAACNPLPEKNPQVPAIPMFDEDRGRDELVERLTLADGATFKVTAPWQEETSRRVVPEVLDGANAGLSRTAAMIAIAGGLLLVAVFGLDLATKLSNLL
ncbi:MAG: LuxR family transcriptional regulator [Novosphingobium pentaromativorans]|uniref:LuxR family transcriptional regulator n=1 Tax=Novosphingobium pentaromativorans TaxID=205844 RepID=A0A2W5NMR4_9SPHN|nr:MAG: LuxR family transcriptional regulator [Novosphingobium pentaromativorans]